ncbi:hypothetical protein [Streptomyces syringium]|uniref:hypothetical protein n=1 Tax=Streptomyces syringium TaxID=76729 RepID=UPI003400FB3E
MADIWVLCQDQRKDKSTLVRADAITYLSVSDEKLTAARLESNEVVTLVHRDAEGGKPLPEHFNLKLLALISEIRDSAREGDEDLVLMAALDDHGRWAWSVFSVSELCDG